MNDASSMLTRLANVWDALIDPSLVTFDTIQEAGGLVSIGVIVLFVGLSFRAAGQMGKPLAIAIGVALAVSLLGNAWGATFVLKSTTVLGAFLRIFGGVVLVKTFFEKPVLSIVFLVLAVASVIVGFIWMPSVGAEQVALLKLVLAVFASVGTFRTLRQSEMGEIDHPAVCVGLAILVCTSSLIEFTALIPEPIEPVGKIVVPLIFKHGFAFGFAIGAVTGGWIRVTGRY